MKSERTAIKAKNTGRKQRKEVVRKREMFACKMYKKKEGQLEEIRDKYRKKQ
jgi:hypothetical protein